MIYQHRSRVVDRLIHDLHIPGSAVLAVYHYRDDTVIHLSQRVGDVPWRDSERSSMCDLIVEDMPVRLTAPMVEEVAA